MDNYDDPAITTALEILDGTVCECGHIVGDHAFWDDYSECQADDGPLCECKQFRPVDFWIQRASVANLNE
jgi:hypothetical protein